MARQPRRRSRASLQLEDGREPVVRPRSRCERAAMPRTMAAFRSMNNASGIMRAASPTASGQVLGNGGANPAMSIDHGTPRIAANMLPMPGWPSSVSTSIATSARAHTTRYVRAARRPHADMLDGSGDPAVCEGGAGSCSVTQDAGHLGGALGEPIVPRLERLAARVVHHGDAARHRADVRAQVAARALVPVGPGDVDAGRLRACDGDVARGRAVALGERVLAGVDAVHRGVAEGHVAEVAADALLRIDVRRNLVIEVQVAPLAVRPERGAAKLVHRLHAL